jgi:hypothetical protein
MLMAFMNWETDAMFTHVKIVTGFMDKHLGQENNKIWAVKRVGCSSMLPAPLH